MSLLDIFAARPDKLAQEALRNEEEIVRELRGYHDRKFQRAMLMRVIFPGADLIGVISTDISDTIRKLRHLLDEEVSVEEVTMFDEERIIADLESLEHRHKVSYLAKLERGLNHASLRHKYVYALFNHLHAVLVEQARLTRLLEHAVTPQLLEYLKQQYELEIHLQNQLDNVEDLKTPLAQLLRAEHVLETLTDDQRRIGDELQKRMYSIFHNELDHGFTYEWADAVMNGIGEKISELVGNLLMGVHEHVEFEFVNRPEFEHLVRETIVQLRHRPASEDMIKAFTYEFREQFNLLNRE